MHRDPVRADTGPDDPGDAEFCRALVGRLTTDAAAGRLPPSLVRVGPARAGGREVAFRALEGAHPVDVLLGASLPHRWVAHGVVTGGRAHRAVGQADGAVGRERVHVACMATRTGDVVSDLRGTDGTSRADGHTVGRIVDLLRRGLGLPTEPPEHGGRLIVVLGWLTTLTAAAEQGPLRWETAATLGTVGGVAAELPGATGGRGVDGGPEPGRVVEAVELLESVSGWDDLHRLASRRGLPEFGLSPAEAAWLDEGALSRWVLADAPALPALVDHLAEHAGPVVAGKVLEVLDGLGLHPEISSLGGT